MPVVIEPSNPNGFPIATTWSPTLSCDEFPRINGAGVKGLPLPVKFSTIFRTAKSLEGSVPVILAVYLFPSMNVTSTILAFAMMILKEKNTS